jgi:hypothetical protein
MRRSIFGGAFAGMGAFAGKGLLQAGVHSLSGGLQSAAFGGNFWQGAASSGISSGFASGAGALGLGGVGTILAGGLSGGVSSELFGGSFWDGARNGLIVAGLNHLGQPDAAPPKPTEAELKLLVYAGVISEAQLLRFGISMTALRSALGTVGLMFLVEGDSPYYVYEISGKDPDLIAKYGVTQQITAENRPQSQIKGIDTEYSTNAPHKWRWVLERTTHSVAFATEKWLVWNYYWSHERQMPYAQRYPGPGAWLKLLNKSKKE